MTMPWADQKWADAPELGSAAMVADQESRIRHYHETLDAYMAAE